MTCSARQREIMEHALGRNYGNKSPDYRNYFATDEEIPDGKECEKMCDLGWMKCTRRNCEIRGGMNCYVVTDLGKDILGQNDQDHGTA